MARLMGQSLLRVPEPCANIGLIWAYGRRMIQKLQPLLYTELNVWW